MKVTLCQVEILGLNMTSQPRDPVSTLKEVNRGPKNDQQRTMRCGTWQGLRGAGALEGLTSHVNMQLHGFEDKLEVQIFR